MPEFMPLPQAAPLPPEELVQRAAEFYAQMRRRRTVRDFSSRPVPREVIELCLMAAGSAPSGANLQPWQFVAVQDSALKKSIRVAAEEEEREFYASRAPAECLAALEPLGTTWEKPFLEAAPWLIAIFHKSYEVLPDGRRVKNYYALESVGIACGFLIAALHHAGLASLTHTPSPMAFLNDLLGRPKNEHPFLLLVTGYPAPRAQVPVISKKALEDFAEFC